MPKIEPIKSIVPEWYKKAEKFDGGELSLRPSDGPWLETNHSLKLCSPFLDGLTSGYYIPLVGDLLVDQIAGVPSLTWRTDTTLVEIRNPYLNPTLPVPAGFHHTQYTWNMPCAYQVPKDYSILVTHPINRYDLPFITLSGIIDGGFPIYPGNIPVFFKNNFEGIIPKGTPIAQLIPFKREDWVLKESDTLFNEADLVRRTSLSKIFGWYKQTHWKKKNYN